MLKGKVQSFDSKIEEGKDVRKVPVFDLADLNVIGRISIALGVYSLFN